MKTCPDCAENVQPDARVCRYCGYRFDRASVSTAGRVWPRVVGTVVYLAAATPPLAAVSNGPENQRLLLGLLEAAFFLLFVGTINWGVARGRHRRRPWWHATFALGPLVIAFAIALLGSIGQQGR